MDFNRYAAPGQTSWRQIRTAVISIMSMGLTPRERRALEIIQAYMAEHDGVAPTLEYIGQQLEITRSGVHRLLGGLETRGAIRRLPRQARAIEIIRPANQFTLPLDLYHKVLKMCTRKDKSPSEYVEEAVLTLLDIDTMHD